VDEGEPVGRWANRLGEPAGDLGRGEPGDSGFLSTHFIGFPVPAEQKTGNGPPGGLRCVGFKGRQ
jgi:hypothetical protein